MEKQTNKQETKPPNLYLRRVLNNLGSFKGLDLHILVLTDVNDTTTSMPFELCRGEKEQEFAPFKSFFKMTRLLFSFHLCTKIRPLFTIITAIALTVGRKEWYKGILD